MNLIAIDYGEKRIGIAKGSNETKMALPFCIIDNKNNEYTISEIQKIIKEEDIQKIIIGVPLNLHGDDTDQTNSVYAFIKILKNSTNLPVEYFDERLTSREANNLFNDGTKRRIDDVAAMIMLQNYLDKK